MTIRQVDPENSKIGWIGTGVMGQSMASHLMNAGYSLTIYTRTREKAAALEQAGASWADSPKEIAQKCNVIFTIVGYPHDVRDIYLGKEGLVNHASAGSVLIDMTTSAPSLAEEISSAAGALGIHTIDAPVSGGDIGARNGTLSIMIGGDRDAVDALENCWNLLGKTIVYQGSAGSGQHTKMVNQTLIASGMIGVCEALLYAYRSGLNVETVLESVSSGAAGSWSLSNLAPRMIKDDFDPGFFVDHFVKDMGIALEEAKRMKLVMPGLALAHQFYVSMQANQRGQCGTQSLILTLSEISGIDWNSR